MKTVSSKISILIKYGETFIQQEMGRYFRLKNFYNVEMPGKEGMIPNYILKNS